MTLKIKNMRKNTILLWLAFFAGSLIFSACSEYQKVLKSDDRKYKYEKAMEYYDNEDWTRAMTLFEELLPIYRGTKEGEEMFFKYAYCNYNIGDYILGGHYFRKFVETFGNSPRAEEAFFKSAYCYYLDSPRPSLDQTSTRKAIEEFLLFINKYPESDKVQQAYTLIEEMRNKLVEKSFIGAKLYFDLSDYKAAITALELSLRDHPESDFREEQIFHLVKSHFLLAENSIPSKQKERYKATLEQYQSFVSEFPESDFRKEADKIQKKSQKELQELQEETANR